VLQNKTGKDTESRRKVGKRLEQAIMKYLSVQKSLKNPYLRN
jgi:hypothetical protein